MEVGTLNQVMHVYPYDDLQQRTAVREALAHDTAKAGVWPPQTGVRPIRQENKILVPTAFSPVR